MGRARWIGLVGISLGVAMIIVDATIINVAVPQIIRDLGITSTDAQWVQEAYTLVFAALLLVAGGLADRYGRRLLFVSGVVVFVLASVFAALAGTGELLIAARLLQGVGGAMILPSSLSLLNATFVGRERGIAFAVWGSTIGGTAALGPLLGGWLTTSFSWRWAFGINIPLGVIILALVLTLVPESRDAHARRGLDLGGAALSVVGVTGIVFALIEGRNYGWWGLDQPFQLFGWDWPWTALSPVPVAAAVGALAIAAFVGQQRARQRAGRPALLDLSLFGIASFRNGNITAAIVSLGEFGLLFGLPLWFQNVLGYSAFRTGLALLPLAVGSFLASGLGAPITARRGPAYVVRIGLVAEIVGIVGIGLVVGPDTAWYATVGPLFVYGIGVGLATAQLSSAILIDVPVDRSGQGSGTQSTSRQLGSALGVAVLGTVLFSGAASYLDARLDLPAPQREQVVSAVKQTGGAVIAQLPAPIAEQARLAFSDATSASAYVAAGFLVLGLLASLRLRSRRPSEEQPPVASARSTD